MSAVPGGLSSRPQPRWLSEEEPVADPRAVRRLVRIAGGLTAFFIVAALTGRWVAHAWLLAFLTVFGAWSFYSGFLVRSPIVIWRARLQASFVVAVGLLLVVGYFGRREVMMVEELSAIIVPVPEITDQTYVPNATEMGATSAFAVLLGSPGAPPVDGTATFWLFKTKLREEEVVAFYLREENRRGWTLESEDDSGWMSFTRGAERLSIMIYDDWPRPGTSVAYVHNAK